MNDEDFIEDSYLDPSTENGSHTISPQEGLHVGSVRPVLFDRDRFLNGDKNLILESNLHSLPSIQKMMTKKTLMPKNGSMFKKFILMLIILLNFEIL